MFCPKCGKSILEGEVCSCETTTTTTGSNTQDTYGQAQQPYSQQQQIQQPYNQMPYGEAAYNQQQSYGNPYAQPIPSQQMYNQQPADMMSNGLDRANAVIKEACGSTLTMVLALIITISFAMSFIGTFISSSGSTDSAETLTGSIFGGIIGLIPMFFMVLGSWLVIHSAKSDEPRVRTTGFTMIRGYLITMVVIFAILLAVITIVGFFLIAMGEGLGEYIREAFGSAFYYQLGLDELGGNISAVLMIGIFIVDIVLAMFIVIYSKISGSVKHIKRITLGMVKGNISTFAAIMLFIFGGFSAITMIVSLVGGDIYSSISTMFTIAAEIIGGVCLLNIKKQLSITLGR